jgi:NADPH2:quinone reductase
VGSVLVPWLKAVGAIVIAHAGTAAKAERAREAGADEALSCPIDRLAQEVRALTSGRGVDVVLDGVGAASWDASIQSVARRGMIVTYGNASGPVPPFSALDLLRAGSVFVTRPSLFDYGVTREEMQASATRLFDLIADGTLAPRIGGRFPLKQAADAHRALEGRTTSGSTILLP